MTSRIGAMRMTRVCVRLASLGVLGSVSPMATAASVPWTPSLAARHAIEVLVDDGGLALTVSQWPLPREAVQRALDALPAELTPALDSARAVVRAELRAQKAGRIGLTLRDRKDALPGYGDDATPGSSLQLRSGEYDYGPLAMQAGGRLDAVADSGRSQATVRLDDSAVVAEAFGIQAQAWAHRSWWGPGWQSALPLSNNPPALDGIGLQRGEALPSTSRWLSWLGPWNTDFFVARTEGEAPGPGTNALLSGWRVTARPWSLLEVGLTRMVQFGGTGHPETLGSFARAVVGAHANAQSVAAQSRDSGNGLAGVDLRLRCLFGIRCAGYAQVMGEDDRKHLPFKYLETVGAEAWSPDGAMRFWAEASEVGCRETWKKSTKPGCAYNNYAYPDGFTASNRWLGASVGADGKLLTLGWIDTDWDSAVRISYGHVGSHVGTFGVPFEPAVPGRPMWALSARRSWHVGPTTLTPEFDWTRVEWTGGFQVSSRFGLEMSTPLDDFGLASPDRVARALDASASPTAARLWTAAALIGAAAVFDRAANSYAYEHHNEPSLKVMRQAAATLPYAEFALAGTAWLTRRGSADGDVALASVESGVSSVVLAEGLKLVVDRSRPFETRGAADFGHEKRSDSSFPSVHTALAWGVITPFAQRYDAPWLYGVAALVNVGRVADHQHWLSDTVAGSVLGYVVGDWFTQRASTAPSTSVMLIPHGVVLATAF